MKNTLLLLIGLTAFLLVGVPTPEASAAPADNIIGLVTPEVESLSAVQVKSFAAPTANCVAHRMTATGSPIRLQFVGEPRRTAETPWLLP